jgi:pimeloyl-ACP methyl ester carboxylesterase
MSGWDWSGIVALALLILGAWFVWEIRPWRESDRFKDLPVRSLTVGDWSFRYHLSGRGPYLLLLHGLGANLFCWRWIIPILNRKFTVVAIDLPGFGQSSKPVTARYGLDDQVERLKDALAGLGISQTYAVGNSMGGNIALWLALKFPSLIKGVCVIAPATSPRLVPLRLYRWAFAARPLSLILTRSAMRWAHRRTVSRRERVSEDRIEETFRTYGRQKEAVRSFMLATEAIRDPRLPGALSALKSPVLILWGSLDKLVPRRVIGELRKTLPGAESIEHDGGGHHLQEDEPEWVSEKISTFFRV